MNLEALKKRETATLVRVAQYSGAGVTVFALASICWGLLPQTGYLFAALVFLMAIVLAGMKWHRGPVTLMAVLSALVWNFFFIPPQFTLHIEKPQDMVMFALFFVVALSMGHLISRLREREEALELHHHEREALLAAKHRADLLAESERLQRALLDSVSHELKTPIAVIRAALDGLGTGDPWSGEIRTAVMRLQRIVESFLEMTRMESGVLTAQKDWCDPGDVLQSAQEPLTEELQRHPLQITADDLPLLKLDGRLLAQALTNVLHNATVYAPPDSPIELTAGVEAGSLILRVRDHGPGLPAGEEERVFDKFHRVPGSPVGGTGLGLAIARGFVRAQGGELTARTHPGGGAEFTFTIPVETHPV
jgi:K+-sensing histidine kinase KdpD